MVGMWQTDLRIELTEDERQDLERLDRSLTAPHPFTWTTRSFDKVLAKLDANLTHAAA
jgi:hypothetical protein